MSAEIENRGSKGYFMLYFFIGLALFLALVISVYQTNFEFIG